MRFALAIVAFIAAAVMIGFGIAQRILLEPDRVSLSAEVEGQAAYTVIEPDALGAYPASRRSRCRAPTTCSSRTDGLRRSPHGSATRPTWRCTTTPRPRSSRAGRRDRAGRRRRFDGRRRGADAAGDRAEGGTEAAVDPAASRSVPTCGSTSSPDERSVTTIDVPDDISVLLATDGTAPAPTDLAIAWPLDNSTPWAGPLLAGGALVFLGGIALLVSGLRAPPSFARPPSQPAQGPNGKLPARTEAADAPPEPGRQRSGRAAPSAEPSGSPSCRSSRPRRSRSAPAPRTTGRASTRPPVDRAGHRDRNADSDGGARRR